MAEGFTTIKQNQHQQQSTLRGLNSTEILFEFDAKIEQERNDNLDKKWREKSEKELGETMEASRMQLRKLRQMLNSTTVVPNGRRDDAFLLRFLRAKKFNAEKAFSMMAKYYSMKQQCSELFKVSPITQLNDLLKMQIQYMIPNRDTGGRRIYIFRVKKCDPYKCPVELVFRTNVLALEYAVREPETQIGGLIVLLDMAGAGLGHAKFLAPNLARRTVEVIQEAFPLRFKAFHILNEPFYFDAILAVLKPFLKEKIRRRIFLHGNNLTSLHTYISKDILPAEYGGSQTKFDNSTWRQSLLDNELYFQRLETFTYNLNPESMEGPLIDDDIVNGNGNHHYHPESETTEESITNSIPFIDNNSENGSVYELSQDYSDPGGEQYDEILETPKATDVTPPSSLQTLEGSTILKENNCESDNNKDSCKNRVILKMKK